MSPTPPPLFATEALTVPYLVWIRRLGQKNLHNGTSAAEWTQSRPAAGRSLRLQVRSPAAAYLEHLRKQQQAVTCNLLHHCRYAQ